MNIGAKLQMQAVPNFAPALGLTNGFPVYVPSTPPYFIQGNTYYVPQQRPTSTFATACDGTTDEMHYVRSQESNPF